MHNEVLCVTEDTTIGAAIRARFGIGQPAPGVMVTEFPREQTGGLGSALPTQAVVLRELPMAPPFP